MCGLTVCLAGYGQEQGDTGFRPISSLPFIYVADVLPDSVPQLSDSLFLAVARGLSFRVNRTELLPDDPFIRLYDEEIAPLLNEQNLCLYGIQVRGAASPEGPYDNNCRLARDRTLRLFEFLTARLVANSLCTPALLQRQEMVVEDYAYLLELMRRHHDPYYDEVSALLTRCGRDEACCKEALQRLHGGTVWSHLYRRYFPALRQARAVFFFVRRPDMQPLDGTPQRGHLLADSLQPRPRAPRALIPLTEQPAVRYTRRHLLALRTNLLHDAFYMPGFGWAPTANVQLEYYPLRGHYTYNLGFTFSNHRHWQSCEFFQVRDLRLEVRRYFRGGGRFLGTFLQAGMQGTDYGFGLDKERGWQGEGGGASLGIGHSLRLNRKGSLRLEFTFDVGCFLTRYDPYVYGNPVTHQENGYYYYDYTGKASDFKRRNQQLFWIGPTNAGIHLTYDILYRKKKPVAATEEGGAL